jgi:hypothetical protein
VTPEYLTVFDGLTGAALVHDGLEIRLDSPLTSQLLLLTATPHNGKEEDFQLFMSLIDGDRFEGRYREARRMRIALTSCVAW